VSSLAYLTAIQQHQQLLGAAAAAGMFSRSKQWGC